MKIKIGMMEKKEDIWDDDSERIEKIGVYYVRSVTIYKGALSFPQGLALSTPKVNST